MTTTELDARVDITEREVAEALRCPPDFALGRDTPHYEELFTTWSLGPCVLTRDAGLRARSNYAALLHHLRSDPSLRGEWALVQCDHWGGGWVKHLAFHAVDAGGAPTRVFRVLRRWFDALAEHPVADEEDYASRQREAALDHIRSDVFRLLSEEAARLDLDYVAERVWRWFWDHAQDALDDHDDTGARPTEAALTDALRALGWLDPDRYPDPGAEDCVGDA